MNEEIHDFVVIGAGPAGCVVASRLTEDSNVSAVLIESGPDRRGFLGTNVAVVPTLRTATTRR